MPRIAAISDIHGNLPALEAVLDEIRRAGADEVVVCGDVVPGPMAEESVAALLSLPVPVRFLQGNGERDLLALQRGEEPTRVPGEFLEGMRWTLSRLSPEHRAALAAWPLTVRSEVPGLGDVLFCHATPRDDNELFTRLTPERRLRPIFEPTNAALVVCGHTHMQFDRRVGDVRVVNAGSVGMPFGPPGAYWALLGPDVALRRTSYDRAAAAGRIARTGFPAVEGFDLLEPPPESKMLELFEAAALR